MKIMFTGKSVMGIFFTGLLLGILFSFGLMVGLMPKVMLKEQVSPLSYKDTLKHIEEKVTAQGWEVSRLMELDKSLAKKGKKVLPVATFKICQADHAEKILLEDESRFISVMMPCSISVYEKADGKTYVSTMNAKLMGRLFGGTIADVMSGPVAKETAAMVKF